MLPGSCLHPLSFHTWDCSYMPPFLDFFLCGLWGELKFRFSCLWGKRFPDPSPFYLLFIFYCCILSAWSTFHCKTPKAEWLKQQKFISSVSWRLEVWDPGVAGLVSPEASMIVSEIVCFWCLYRCSPSNAQEHQLHWIRIHFIST